MNQNGSWKNRSERESKLGVPGLWTQQLQKLITSRQMRIFMWGFQLLIADGMRFFLIPMVCVHVRYFQRFFKVFVEIRLFEEWREVNFFFYLLTDFQNSNGSWFAFKIQAYYVIIFYLLTLSTFSLEGRVTKFDKKFKKITKFDQKFKKSQKTRHLA